MIRVVDEYRRGKMKGSGILKTQYAAITAARRKSRRGLSGGAAAACPNNARRPPKTFWGSDNLYRISEWVGQGDVAERECSNTSSRKTRIPVFTSSVKKSS
jgi:hypothetical protein